MPLSFVEIYRRLALQVHRAWLLGGVSLFIWLLGSSLALAQDVLISVADVSPRLITFEISLGGRTAEKILGALEEGVPTRVSYVVEIWRGRAGWFDRLEGFTTIEFTVRYDPWADEFLVESPDIAERSFRGQEALIGWLEDHGPLELPLRADLAVDRAFYLAVTATVKPLSAEQVGAVERWLGGDNGDKRESMPGGRRGIRGYLMGFILDISGLGELKVTGRSQPFRAFRVESPGESPGGS